MKVLVAIILISALVLTPFVLLKRPWAVQAWARIKSMFVLYVAVIIFSAIYWLITRWDDFYG